MKNLNDFKIVFTKKFFTTKRILIVIIVILSLIIVIQNINRYGLNNHYKQQDSWSNSNFRIPGMGWWGMEWWNMRNRSFSR